MSEKSRLSSDPPPKSLILGDFEGGLVRKSPRMEGWGASVRIFDTSQTSSQRASEGRGEVKATQQGRLSPDENLKKRGFRQAHTFIQQCLFLKLNVVSC
jgi:hypothetical protein